MTQIVINRCYGGFGLSQAAEDRYRELSGKPYPEFRWEAQRDDPYLVQVVLELGERSWAHCAELAVVTIPDDVQWQIDEYDGAEWIAEVHRTWR